MPWYMPREKPGLYSTAWGQSSKESENSKNKLFSWGQSLEVILTSPAAGGDTFRPCRTGTFPSRPWSSAAGKAQEATGS